MSSEQISYCVRHDDETWTTAVVLFSHLLATTFFKHIKVQKITSGVFIVVFFGCTPKCESLLHLFKMQTLFQVSMQTLFSRYQIKKKRWYKKKVKIIDIETREQKVQQY